MRAVNSVVAVIFLFSVWDVVTSETKIITAKIGSDLHFLMPELCDRGKEVFCDLDTGNKVNMGNYHHKLQARNGYQGRLHFILHPCTIILNKWTMADGLHFTSTIQSYDENGQRTTRVVNYNISIEGDVTRNKYKANGSSPRKSLSVYTILFLCLVCIIIF